MYTQQVALVASCGQCCNRPFSSSTFAFQVRTVLTLEISFICLNTFCNKRNIFYTHVYRPWFAQNRFSGQIYRGPHVSSLRSTMVRVYRSISSVCDSMGQTKRQCNSMVWHGPSDRLLPCKGAFGSVLQYSTLGTHTAVAWMLHLGSSWC